MKKKYLGFAAAFILTGVLFTGCQGNSSYGSQQVTPGPEQQTTAQGTGKESGTEQQTAGITEEEAKTIALEHANVQESDVTGIRVKKDREDGYDIYDVEFYVQNKEYDYEVSVTDGAIIQSDYSIEDDFSIGSNTGNTQSENLISEEDAKNAALARVEGATEQDIRIKLDYDDGKSVYEGDIFYNNREYEFEIDAATGDFLEWSEEGR